MGVSKHLKLMRAAGVLNSRRCPNDGRLERYYLPLNTRVANGFLDYGFCTLQIPNAMMSLGGKD
jgi:hypothetical protein